MQATPPPPPTPGVGGGQVPHLRSGLHILRIQGGFSTTLLIKPKLLCGG